MMHCRCWVWGIAWLLVLPAALVRADTEPLPGLKCLYVGLRSLDIDVGSYAKFVQQHGDVKAVGLSLDEMRQIAEAYGTSTLVVETSLQNLTRRPGRFACVAHVDGNHFVNVLEIGPHSVTIADPPQSGEVATGLFLKRWPGRALLLSKQPLVAEEALPSRSPWVIPAVSGALIAVLIMIALTWRWRRAQRT